MNYPENLKYTNEHEWIRLEGDVAYVGITEYAQEQLGDIVFIDINCEGETLAKGEVFGTIEVVKTVSDLFLPVGGEVLEKNAEYIFDTSLWVQEEEPVFLLSTFYEALPERSGESLFYTTGQEGKAVVSGSYQDYRARLLALAEEAGYGPELVLSAAKDRLQSAVERDYAYFEALSFTVADSAALAITNQTAAALLDSASATPASWEGIRGLLLAE